MTEKIMNGAHQLRRHFRARDRMHGEPIWQQFFAIQRQQQARPVRGPPDHLLVPVGLGGKMSKCRPLGKIFTRAR